MHREQATWLAIVVIFAAVGHAQGESAALPPPARYAVSTIDVTWNDAARGRSIPVRMYLPTETSERFPVIVFSTGLGRSRDDCAYLGRHWAARGYAAAFVQHPGSDESAQRGLRPRKELQRAFYDEDNIRNRPLDVMFAVDQLERLAKEPSSWASRLDTSRIGAAGHDFGTQTVLALGGQVLPGHLAFQETRISAIVAMSPPVPLGQVPLKVAYGDVSIPCFYITGTEDNSIVGTTQASQRRLPFDFCASDDRYLVTLIGADHMTYAGHVRRANSGNDAMYQRLIAQCSTVFWDAYLKKDDSARQWLSGNGIRDYLGQMAKVETRVAEEP